MQITPDIRIMDWASAEMTTGQYHRTEAIAASSADKEQTSPVLSDVIDMLKGMANYLTAQHNPSKNNENHKRQDSAPAMGM